MNKNNINVHFNGFWWIDGYRMAFNSLRPSDAIWRQWSWTTLAQIMACCLTAPSHYLNQCWLIIRGVLWHTSESSFAGIAQGIDSGYEFEKDILKNIFKSPRGQWVNVVLMDCTSSSDSELKKCIFMSQMWIQRIYLVFKYRQIHNEVIRWKHFPRYWPFVRGIHRSPVDSPHKGQWRGAFDLPLNKRLSKQSRRLWFETQSRSLCLCNVIASNALPQTW